MNFVCCISGISFLRNLQNLLRLRIPDNNHMSKHGGVDTIMEKTEDTQLMTEMVVLFRTANVCGCGQQTKDVLFSLLALHDK